MPTLVLDPVPLVLEGLAADGLAIPEPIGPGVYIEHTPAAA
jgi:hypothetical protein